MDNSGNENARTPSLKELLKSRYFWKPALGTLAGGLAGFAYYYFVGCKSGSCPITGSPYISFLWGAMMGFLLFSGSRRK
jgi:hypothetical protein